jgi:hypothetical protein
VLAKIESKKAAYIQMSDSEEDFTMDWVPISASPGIGINTYDRGMQGLMNNLEQGSDSEPEEEKDRKVKKKDKKKKDKKDKDKKDKKKDKRKGADESEDETNGVYINMNRDRKSKTDDSEDSEDSGDRARRWKEDEDSDSGDELDDGKKKKKDKKKAKKAKKRKGTSDDSEDSDSEDSDDGKKKKKKKKDKKREKKDKKRKGASDDSEDSDSEDSDDGKKKKDKKDKKKKEAEMDKLAFVRYSTTMMANKSSENSDSDDELDVGKKKKKKKDKKKAKKAKKSKGGSDDSEDSDSEDSDDGKKKKKKKDKKREKKDKKKKGASDDSEDSEDSDSEDSDDGKKRKKDRKKDKKDKKKGKDVSVPESFSAGLAINDILRTANIGRTDSFDTAWTQLQSEGWTSQKPDETPWYLQPEKDLDTGEEGVDYFDREGLETLLEVNGWEGSQIPRSLSRAQEQEKEVDDQEAVDAQEEVKPAVVNVVNVVKRQAADSDSDDESDADLGKKKKVKEKDEEAVKKNVKDEPEEEEVDSQEETDAQEEVEPVAANVVTPEAADSHSDDDSDAGQNENLSRMRILLNAETEEEDVEDVVADESDEELVDEQEEMKPVIVDVVKPQAADSRSDDNSDAGSESSEDARMRILLNSENEEEDVEEVVADESDEEVVDEQEEVDEQKEVKPVAVDVVKPRAADSRLDDDSDAGSENSEDARMRILLNAENEDEDVEDDVADESDEEVVDKRVEVDVQEEVKPVAVNVVKPQAADSDSDDDSDAGSEDSEDARMKKMLSAWDDDEENSDSSSSSSSDSDDDSDDEAAIRPIIDLKYNVLDHVVLAAPDFVEAMKEFEKMTGIKPEVVGSLRGMGTKSARVGLDNNCYLEILAPDPKNAGPLTAQLKSLEEGTLSPFHFGIRRDDIAELRDDYIPNELGWEPDHIGMGGTTADGTPKPYNLCFMHGHKLGGIVPYYIVWGECEHPTARIPEVGNLKSFTVRAPGGHKIHALLKDVDYVSTEIGEPSLEFSFGSPEGTITFSGDNPLGLKFPGTFNILNGK